MSLKRQGHCHVGVRAENPDLASQIDRHDVYTRLVSCSTPLAGPSVLSAIHTVLHPLSGSAAETPVRARRKAMLVPAPESRHQCRQANETTAVLAVKPRTAGDAACVADL